MAHSRKKGVLLINVGTPASTSVKDVRAYLKAFLDDPRVIDLPWWIRKPLLYGIILPFRAPKSAHAYQQIWHASGVSPLLLHMTELKASLQQQLGPEYIIEMGMRYGQPSIEQALKNLLAEQCSVIKVLPLYPQYASASTGTALEAVFAILSQQYNIPGVEVIEPFYQNEGYIQSLVAMIAPRLEAFNPDKLVLSYHSLPLRQIKKSATCPSSCFRDEPCPSISAANQYCYRAHSYATARALTQGLKINDGHVDVVFQSKLGKTPWVGPDLLAMMPQWHANGVKRLLVACPSFVVDCLETLEEVGMRAREAWLAQGGEAFELVPCLNSDPVWVKSLLG